MLLLLDKANKILVIFKPYKIKIARQHNFVSKFRKIHFIIAVTKIKGKK